MSSTATPEVFKLALCQIAVTADKQKNIETAKDYITRAASSGASIVVLPECFNAPYSTSFFREYAESIQLPSTLGSEDEEGEVFLVDSSKAPSIHMLQEQAMQNNVYIVGGSVPEIDEQTDKIYNTSITISSRGQILARHRKAHLFDIDIPGKITFKESSVLSPGEGTTVFKYKDQFNVGVSICYDIRFQEFLAIQTQKHDAKLLIIPGAFNMTTGPAHWELLIRSRAVDNQVFVAACSPARSENKEDYQAWGHSMIANPWGQVLCSAADKPEIIMADIDMSKLNEVRQNVPIRKQKRTDIYQLSQA